MIKGVMFDFSGTLFRIETVAEWFDTLGLDLSGSERARCIERLTAAGAQPGGPQPLHAPDGWGARDTSAAHHRAAYTAQARAALLPVTGPERADALAAALYLRHLAPEAWRPYPDAEPVLKELRRRGVPVAVVSNIGWDLRPIFVRGGLDGLVDAFVLSFELGVQKPDPRIFRSACERLGLPPAQVLMVGDHRPDDGGATALGCPFYEVDPLPVEQRPQSLSPVLDLVAARPE
ncbi:HAD family hydrolase [Streptacidiphilus sp. PB12-B1b]|uniref:HAD family hydrolase n=1 Tax=Streptacidiphilus sp. PB12-B1b TaxID=2705012 RepID=UPI0015FCEAFB|nr:HAD family hydrolase [Streptacidiphilus sp. PB12-B1b]